MRTRFTDVVGCRAPIQQAPMGTVSTPELAVAVANAGGLGTITALGMAPDALAALLDGMRSATDGALGANFLTGNVDREALEVAASRVKVCDFFWSDPDPELIDLAHAGGALAAWQVGTVEQAESAAAAGCDVIVAQGTEAGGHVWGETSLLPLLDAVLDAVDVPVLAAGA